MRGEMSIGDLVIFYHSNGDPSGAAGVAKVVSHPYPDPTQFDPKSPYHDPKSKPSSPSWHLVDVAFVKRFKDIVTREKLKSVKALRNMKLWRLPRLSVVPLTKSEFDAIVKLGNIK